MVLSRSVVSGEEPVLPSQRHPLQRPFAGVVVDVQVAAGSVRGECLPLVLGVGDRLGRRAAGDNLVTFRVEPGLDPPTFIDRSLTSSDLPL